MKEINIHIDNKLLFCAYCGNELELMVETDINSGRTCKSKLCELKLHEMICVPKIKLQGIISEYPQQKATNLIELFEASKTQHEIPNDNTAEYNEGYVKAMNNIINRLKEINQ